MKHLKKRRKGRVSSIKRRSVGSQKPILAKILLKNMFASLLMVSASTTKLLNTVLLMATAKNTEVILAAFTRMS